MRSLLLFNPNGLLFDKIPPWVKNIIYQCFFSSPSQALESKKHIDGVPKVAGEQRVMGKASIFLFPFPLACIFKLGGSNTQGIIIIVWFFSFFPDTTHTTRKGF